MRYDRLYFQKMAIVDGEGNAVTHEVKETISSFQMYPMTMPFAVGGEAKKLPSNDWPDEDGLEEYVPEDGIPLQAYEIELQFGFRFDGATGQYGLYGLFGRAQAAMDAFRKYLTGRDGSGVWLMFFSEHTGVGRQKVRFSSMDPEPEYIKTKQGERLFCKVKLKIDDPVTQIRYDRTNNRLEEVV